MNDDDNMTFQCLYCIVLLSTITEYVTLFYFGRYMCKNQVSMSPLCNESILTLFSQFRCSQCDRWFKTERRLKVHKRSACHLCPNCLEYFDKRHIARCKGPRLNRGQRFVCPFCNRLRSGHNMTQHFYLVHNKANYVHPTPLLTEVIICMTSLWYLNSLCHYGSEHS